MNFKQTLKSGALIIGTFQKSPSMIISEVLGQTELDVICLDAEHSPFDRKDIDACVLAFRASSKPVLVRIPAAHPEHILNALDCGANGVVVPHVDSPEKAIAIAKAATIEPGGRGYAGSSRAAQFGSRTIQQNLDDFNSNPIVIAQIEDLCALEKIDEIISAANIDCYFIGMADLAVALGEKSLSGPKVKEAALSICQAAKKFNRRLGMFVADLNEIPFWREQGVSLFLLASEHNFIKQGAKQLLSQTKQSQT